MVDHPQGLGVTRAVPPAEEEQKLRNHRELGGIAEATVLRIPLAIELFVGVFEELFRGNVGGGLSVVAEEVHNALSIGEQIFTLAVPELGNFSEECHKPRMAEAVCFREVCARKER